MNSERWKRIEQVYYGVLASPPMNRAGALEELCSDDQEVRREVESLLDARAEAGRFLSAGNLCDQVGELFSEYDAVGQALGPYQIVSAIGSGAMGDVYLARDSRLDRQVALKILPASFTRDSARVTRFRREARAASALSHPNIITIYDIGEVAGTWFIASEFIEGTTLRSRLCNGRMGLSELLDIAIQCALALHAAHQAGIVHRDIKPENIMVRPDGLVKVLDFGLARIASAGESSADATQAGTLIGTPRYMSPEQARGEKLDGRTDIFSLGAVVYEMATAQQAFTGATTADVFASLLGSPSPLLTEYAHNAPRPLERIVSKALQKDCDARYQSMREFAADLQDLKQRPLYETQDFSRKPALERSNGPGRRRHLIPITIAIVAALTAGWWLRTNRPTIRPELASLTVVPLTSFEGYKDFGSFSPDGNRIAFSWNGSTGRGRSPERNIYITTIGRDSPVQLTFLQADDRLPVWSPDGRYIAFCRPVVPEPTPSRYGIYVVPTSGGREREIAEGGKGVSWSPDGTVLAIAGTPADAGGIFLLSIDGRLRRQLTNPRPYIDSLPVFSTDGRWIAFTRDFGFSAREIFVVPASGGAARQLTFDRQPTYGAAWTADNHEIVFSSNRGSGGESLWRVPVTGGAPRRVSATLQGVFYPYISRQGNRLAYTESFIDTNIYSLEGSGFGNRIVPGYTGEAKPLIMSSRRDDSPTFSPDGERIAFVSKRTGNEEIWVCDRNGQGLVRLTSFGGPGTGTPRWSPDGRWIAFDSLAAGNPNIYVIAASGGAPRRLTSGPSGNFMPSWSPDAQWIYFKSDRSGTDQIWKIRFVGGEPHQVTSGGGCEAFVSPDGKLVYFTKRAWSRIWSTPVAGGPEKPVPELARFSRVFRSWGVTNHGIYFISREDVPHQTIRFFSFATRRVVPLAALDREPVWDYPDIALSPSGHQLLFASLDQEFNDLMLIENFR